MGHRPLIGHPLLAVIALVLGLAAGLAADGHEAIASDPATEAVEAGQRFLDRYVEPDGRVVRRDQGGDTVSEGQAYALLIAVGVGDHARFERIRTWTRDHLQRDDALLSWHWANGGVVDPEPATDADLAAASALARAGERWSVNDYLVDARRLAAAVLEHETVTTTTGAALVAGPWARETRTVNPSYLMPVEARRMLWLSGDASWVGAASTARALVAELASGAPHLPADWATVGDDAVDVTPRDAPGGDSPRYGFEAVRVLVVFAADCNPDGRQIPAEAWPFFRSELDAGRRIVAVYDLTGAPLVDYEHPAGLVAAAAAADAAGADPIADGLLDRADDLDLDDPSYYGAAWIALARLWLDTDRLGGCRP